MRNDRPPPPAPRPPAPRPPAPRPPALPVTDSRSEETFQMSDELIVLVRHRLNTRFYEQPHVIDAVARRLLEAVAP